MQTGDQYLMKKINKTIVLEAIIRRSPISRAQISELSGLNKSTVSSLVSELIEERLVEDTGPGASNGGRKPFMLEFHQEAGFAVGVDLGVNYITAVLVDLSGAVIQESFHPLTGREPERIVPQLRAVIEDLAAAAHASPYGVVGVTIGVPGIVDDRGTAQGTAQGTGQSAGQGTVLFAPNLGWENINLAEILQPLRGNTGPLAICNEANAGAVGELHYGAARDVRDMIYISVGMGIGAGVILGRELYLGSNGFSGEAGHVSIRQDGGQCTCGNTGCWELYASERALLEQAAKLPGIDLEHRMGGSEAGELKLPTLVRLAEEGNAEVIGLFGEIAEALAVGVVNMMNLFNPQLIVIGNRFAALERWLGVPLRQAIERRSPPYLRRTLTVAFSQLGTRSAALGAAHLAIAQFFAAGKASVQ
jgi:predicted NBD/HSP70 family sugar kinase